jgi:hypothetical protein
MKGMRQSDWSVTNSFLEKEEKREAVLSNIISSGIFFAVG